MDKIEKIRKYIEERLVYYPTIYTQAGRELIDLRNFLDTLSEEDTLPCWKKVHTYTEELREGDMEKMLLDLSVGKGKRETKIALPDRVVDALEKEPDKSLEKSVVDRELIKAAEFCYNYGTTSFPDKSLEEAAWDCVLDSVDVNHPVLLPKYKELLTYLFIAGAEWQARQLLQGSPMPEDTALFNKGVQEGRRLEREDMLKDAVEGKIYGYDDGSYELVVSWLDLPKGGIYKDGDKVRIVVLKEEE